MDKQLLLTRFDAGRSSRGEMLSVADVLEILSIPLLGIIPESEDILRASNLGAPVTMNGAASLAGPRLSRRRAPPRRRNRADGGRRTRRRRCFNRLFGRRAA